MVWCQHGDRRVHRARWTGSVRPGKIGGYRPKKISGPWRDWLVRRCNEQDFTLHGLMSELAEHSLMFDYSLVRAFVQAGNLSHKKDADCPRAGPS
jgi:putative transposase